MSRCDTFCLPERHRLHLLVRGLVMAFAVLACLAFRPFQTSLQQLHERGTLEVIALASPTNVVQQGDITTGLQFELTRLFAEDLGISVHITTVATPQEALKRLKRNEATLAITGLSTDDPRLKKLRVSPPYLSVPQLVIGRRNSTEPADSLAALDNALVAVIGDSSEARLADQLNQVIPGMQLIKATGSRVEDLLDLVDAGNVDYVIMNAAEFDSRRAMYPALDTAISLNKNSNLAWAFVRQGDDGVYRAAERFFARIQSDGTLDRLVAFYSAGKTFDAIGARTFQKDIANRLPRYRPLFEKYAAQTGMDWRMLAAIAYQESKWEASAVSPTGVQGIMMLTAATAEHVGVDNRSSAPQSIRGGAEYFRMIRDSLPKNIADPDRTWMALAAYNMGPGHLHDARKLTSQLGEDPDKWLYVSKNIKLLAQPRWYKQTKHGHTTNTGQALLYVKSIRRYYEALLLATNDAPATDRDSRLAMK